MDAPITTLTAAEGLVNYSLDGATYVSSIDPVTGVLDVRHVRWDGTEAWSTTVAPPTLHAKDAYTARMSYDDQLGVVAIWFTMGGIRYRPTSVDSPVVALSTSTGERLEIEPLADGDLAGQSFPVIIGSLLSTDDGIHGGIDRVRFLGSDPEVRELASGVRVPVEVGSISAFQRAGHVIIAGDLDPAADAASWSVEVDGTIVATGLSGQWDVVAVDGVLYLVDHDHGTVSRVDGSTLHAIDTGACDLRLDEVGAREVSLGAIIGDLVMPSGGEPFCVTDAVTGTNLVAATLLPGGDVLLMNPQSVGAGSEAAGATASTGLPAPSAASASSTPSETADAEQAEPRYRMATYSPVTGAVTDLGVRPMISFYGDGVLRESADEDTNAVAIELYRAEDLNLTGR